jgi:single-stranded-DNA-specific exonuclease
MDRAVTRLVKAFKSKEKICIYGDFDLDGTSGLAVLSEGFRAMGYLNLVTFQPLRLKEGYGFHAWAIDEMKAQGVSLIVTVDVGITAFAACDRAKKLGIDVIITDHHLPSQGIPDAFCVINPNQGNCDSGLGYLSGAGVGFYLCRALLRALVDEGLVKGDPRILNDLLDFVVIATITDMVPMIGDNRPLVKAGLKQLSTTKRPGLRALLDMVGLGNQRDLSVSDVAIRLAPKLNALSRMELGLRPVDILLESDLVKAQSLMQKVQEQNGMRMQLQQEGERVASKEAERQSHQDFIFVVDSRFHRGVIGLIATKLARDFNKPVFIGSLGEDGRVTGSARLPEGYPLGLTDALTSAKDVLVRFGGHFGAAGFEFDNKDQEPFKARLAQFYQDSRKAHFTQILEYDFDLHPRDVSLDTIQILRTLEPFGQGFEYPLFGLKNLYASQIKELKGGHLKVFFNPVQDSNFRIEGLAFGVTPEMGEIIKDPRPKDVLVELQQNDFNGNSSAQVRIREIKFS